jgi:nitronate monooxygenase
MVLGASGVQLGTAFLRCPEANVTAPHRQAIENATEDNTRLTRAFSGRPARSLRNLYLDELAPYDTELPDFPLMNPLSKPLRVASEKANVPDCLPLWCGQAVRLVRDQNAKEVVRMIVDQLEERTISRGRKIPAFPLV